MSTPGFRRNTLALAVAAVLIGVVRSTGQEFPLADRAVDRDRISTTLVHWEEAWNRHDMHAFASLFHEDGMWILWTGDVWSGRDAIERGDAAVHKTVFRNSIQRERLEELRSWALMPRSCGSAAD